jgi:hypothetical protein
VPGAFGCTVSTLKNRPNTGAKYRARRYRLPVISSTCSSLNPNRIVVYIVTAPDGGQQLFPALHDIVLSIDPAAGRMLIRPASCRDHRDLHRAALGGSG